MLLALLLAAALAPVYAVDPSASTLKYTVTHKLHCVDATSKEAEGKAVVRPDGKVLTQVRAPIISFRSGDGNRDEHMDEAMNVGTYPSVVFKGIAHLRLGGQLPPGPLQMDGEVDLHGVKRPYQVALTVAPEPGGALRVTGRADDLPAISSDERIVQRLPQSRHLQRAAAAARRSVAPPARSRESRPEKTSIEKVLSGLPAWRKAWPRTRYALPEDQAIA